MKHKHCFLNVMVFFLVFDVFKKINVFLRDEIVGWRR